MEYRRRGCRSCWRYLVSRAMSVGWATARCEIFTRGQNRAALLPTRRDLSRRFCPPYDQASRQAAREAFPDLLLRQLAADEDEPAFALLAVLPGALVIAIEDHVHALEHEAIVIVLECKNALAAQDARPFGLHEVLHPGKEFVGIE